MFASCISRVTASERGKATDGSGAGVGDTSELSEAFGPQPFGKCGGGIEDGPLSENDREVFVGSSRVDENGIVIGSGDGEGNRANAFEDSKKQQQEASVASPVVHNAKPSLLDTLDRLMGLRGTLRDNFSQSITFGPTLSSSMDLSKKRKGEDMDNTHKSKKNNEIYISESSDEGADGREGHEDGDECPIVVNPLFMGNLTRPAVSREKGPG